MKTAAEAVYSAAVQLWFDSGVERHGEGHPGLPGPSEGQPWDETRARIEGAITTLRIILERKYLCAAVQPRWPGRSCTREAGHEGPHSFTEGINTYRWTTP